MLIFCTKDCIEKPLYIYLANLTQRQTCFIQTLQAHLDEDLINKGQCWCVSIEIQTVGWIRMKFGTEVVLKGGGRYLGGGLRPGTPNPWVQGV